MENVDERIARLGLKELAIIIRHARSGMSRTALRTFTYPILKSSSAKLLDQLLHYAENYPDKPSLEAAIAEIDAAATREPVAPSRTLADVPCLYSRSDALNAAFVTSTNPPRFVARLVAGSDLDAKLQTSDKLVVAEIRWIDRPLRKDAGEWATRRAVRAWSAYAAKGYSDRSLPNQDPTVE